MGKAAEAAKPARRRRAPAKAKPADDGNSKPAVSGKLDLRELPIGDLIPNPWNPNKQRDVVARAIRESIEDYGFVDPVTVRPHPDVPGKWQIVNGEHRHQDMLELGAPTISCVVLDLDDPAARKLTMLLNEGGEPDVVLMGALLTDLQRLQPEEEFARAMPYTPAERDHLLSLADHDWSRFDDGRPAQPQRPVVERMLTLPYSVADFDELAGWLDIVKRELGLDDDAAAVREAVKRLALELHQAG